MSRDFRKWHKYVNCFTEAFQYGNEVTKALACKNSSIVSLPKDILLERQDPPKKIIICSPHPDDECLSGALPLRLKQEQGAKVINIAITLGSDPLRKKARSKELENACNTLGFENRIVKPPLAFDNISQNAPKQSKKWLDRVNTLLSHFFEIDPDMVLYPHSDDGHPTHKGVHVLAKDALCQFSEQAAKTVLGIESEFWQPCREPKLLVGINQDDMANLVTGVAMHTGEICRNPYHLRLPARMMDNVRRGGELISGTNLPVPDFCFGEIYNLALYAEGYRQDWPGEKMIFSPDCHIHGLHQL